MKKVLVVGGGLVGALHAANLAEKGYKVKLYERRPDMRHEEIVAGKSINLALSHRGWNAVRMIGLEDAVRAIAIPMHGRKIHDAQGEVSYQPYGKEGQAIYSVSRGELNVALLNRAEKDRDVEMYFDWKCVHVDFDKTTAYFEHNTTGEKREEVADLIFGTDGAFSQVRADMMRTSRFNYEQEFIPHGYRELLLPAGENGTYLMEKNALHIWPRGGYMLIALPNVGGSFTCTLFMPYEGSHSFAALDTDEKIGRFFKETFPDFYALLPDVTANYKRHPLSDLVIIRCYPWARNQTCLLGDASHAIVPFYGQGMNSGFEDCVIMDELMGEHGSDWATILNAFQRKRKPDADAIAELAMRNYVEMRDLVGEPQFLLQKKIEAKIHRKHPEKWTPLYTQVTFTDTPYAAALAEGKRQEKIMATVMSRADIAEVWDSEEIENTILAANAL